MTSIILVNVDQMVGKMVQKDKFRSENSFQKLILTLLIIFTIPLSARSEIKIPSRKNCSLIKKKQSYDYYDRQEAHDFGRKIQTLIAKKDIQGIYKNVLIDELQNGPRREFIKNKSFDQIFPKKWVTKVISTEIDCDSIGWRGFMISNGLIWFDRMESGKWTIKSINGVNQEQFDNKNLIGWKTNKGIIPPTCFPTFGNFEKPKVDLFTEEFGIKNKTKFEYSPGEYIGKTIPLGYEIKTKISKNNVYSVSINLNDCFKWNLENGFVKNDATKNELVLVENIIYQKNDIKGRENHDRYKSHYEVLQRVDLSKCNQLAKQLSQCSDSYLIRIGYHSGGTIGWLGRYYIFGIFEDRNNMEFLVPLKSFENKNLALNELKK